jgi:signal transduction histidine kinase
MQDDSLSFPDVSRGQLDLAIGDLVDSARNVLATQGRLRALLRANQAVVERLELPVVLERIVESAVQLVDADYGALGVISPSGGLEQFINVGMSPEDAAAIGHLPEGHGLLGALIDDPRPIRLTHLADDPRAAGFPSHHPPMDSFLGVPVRVRDEVFGNLYLSNSARGEFSPEDEQLVTALAATAGIAIDNARLFAETKRRQAWSAASAEVTAAILSIEQSDPLATLAGQVLGLANADLVVVVVPTDDPAELVVSVARGLDQEAFTGRRYETGTTLAGSVLEGGQPRLINDRGSDSVALSDGRLVGPTMAIPLMAGGRAEGVLTVSRVQGGHLFTASDLEMAADFAGQASLALQFIKARSAQERMLVLEDRGRIARDLHDHVIQQLFGTGLELQSVAATLPPGTVADRVMQSVGNLDAAITQIRTVIFALSSPLAQNRDSIRHRLIDLASDAAPGLRHMPSVAFAGPVDLVVSGALTDDVLAVAREALANATRHAAASRTSVSLQVNDSAVVLAVVDDGRGMSDTGRRSGIANLEARAEARGGTFTIDSNSGGTRVTWTVPLPNMDGTPNA